MVPVVVIIPLSLFILHADLSITIFIANFFQFPRLLIFPYMKVVKSTNDWPKNNFIGQHYLIQ